MCNYSCYDISLWVFFPDDIILQLVFSVSCLTAPMSPDIEQTITIAVAPVDGGADLASTGTVTFNYRVS